VPEDAQHDDAEREQYADADVNQRVDDHRAHPYGNQSCPPFATPARTTRSGSRPDSISRNGRALVYGAITDSGAPKSLSA